MPSSKSVAIIAPRQGPPEVLRAESRDVPIPDRGQVLVRILASSVSMPDVQARYGRTPFPPRRPFIPGYTYVGDVAAAGPEVTSVSVEDRVGVLGIVGGYAEHALAAADRLIPVPTTVDPLEASTVILNYLVAYQVMHRVAKVKAGDAAVIIGASGGIGTAFLQLGRLAGLRMYGLASAAKHDVVRAYGAVPIDYRSQDFVEVVRSAEPDGVAAVFDGIGAGYVPRGLHVLGRGGSHVVYGNPGSKRGVARLVWRLLTTNLRPGGPRLRFYGTTSYLRHPRPFREDWATLFRLLEDRQIEPVIAGSFPLHEAAAANALLEGGGVEGNLVLDVARGGEPA
jgi:NADPH:quinone reductase-like Zn-dependent oxidoreductase